MLYATEQGYVRHGTPQSRDMCATEQSLYATAQLYARHKAGYVCHRSPQVTRQGSYATEQGYVRDGAPQNKDMYVTEQQGLYVICYRTGLRTPRDSTE